MVPTYRYSHPCVKLSYIVPGLSVWPRKFTRSDSVSLWHEVIKDTGASTLFLVSLSASPFLASLALGKARSWSEDTQAVCREVHMGRKRPANNYVSELGSGSSSSRWWQLWPIVSFLWETPSQNHPTKLLPKSWPTETVRLKMFVVLSGCTLGVICHITNIVPHRVVDIYKAQKQYLSHSKHYVNICQIQKFTHKYRPTGAVEEENRPFWLVKTQIIKFWLFQNWRLLLCWRQSCLFS